MAAEHHFIYTGGGREVIPRHATHFSVHESVTVIPALLFFKHLNIVEIICHIGVKRIEARAFVRCRSLKRAVIPGVEIVGLGAFFDCEAVTDIECDSLEVVGTYAFHGCSSLSDISLPSVRIIGESAFDSCPALATATFSRKLESLRRGAFRDCHSLERITIPLKNDFITGYGILTRDDIFAGCDNLKHVDLIEGAVLNDTIAALHFEEWVTDVFRVLNSITRLLSHGSKADLIRVWIESILDKVIRYKAQHRQLLNEMAATLQLVIPGDIVMNSILPFLELPLHTFDGEGHEEQQELDNLLQRGRVRRRDEETKWEIMTKTQNRKVNA